MHENSNQLSSSLGKVTSEWRMNVILREENGWQKNVPKIELVVVGKIFEIIVGYRWICEHGDIFHLQSIQRQDSYPKCFCRIEQKSLSLWIFAFSSRSDCLIEIESRLCE